jgi:hypothetical protein
VRSEADSEPEWILALGTLGALERRRFRGRSGEIVETADAEPVPTSRATVIDPDPLADAAAGGAWLGELRASGELADAAVDGAVLVLNGALQAHRVARADPHARDVSAAQALVTRIGYGSGEAVADGRYAEAWELPRGVARHAKRSMEAPDERFAALVSGREEMLACEELVMRTRADLDAGRLREAALQARIALETLLAELGHDLPGNRGPALDADRALAADAANEALRGDLSAEVIEGLSECVGRMESALRARRLAGI